MTTATIDHKSAEKHTHTHGPNCGHEALIHEDHVDYKHNGHLHHECGDHYDECTVCECGNCTDCYCATCTCADCTCSNCNHNTCECGNCADNCANCNCSDCTCATCDHAA